MTLIECLKNYKREVIELGNSFLQKKFLENSFSRWYINVDKEVENNDSDGIFPAYNIIHNEAIIDMQFANMYHKTAFNINDIITKSNTIYIKYKSICKSLIEKDKIYYHLPKIINSMQSKRLALLYLESLKAQNPDDNTKIESLVDDSEFNNYKNKLVNLYQFIGINNMHLGIPPIFSGVELFGSPLNTHNKFYCSPFLLEKKFNSLGSFFEYSFHKNGIYLCNPPFDEILIKRMAERLLSELKKTKYKVIIIITIPIWDNESQLKLGIKSFGMRFEGYDLLVNNKYLRDHEMLDKDEYSYYNYYTNKKAPASWTHLITLSNLSAAEYKKKFSFNQFLKKWKSF